MEGEGGQWIVQWCVASSLLQPHHPPSDYSPTLSILLHAAGRLRVAHRVLHTPPCLAASSHPRITTHPSVVPRDKDPRWEGVCEGVCEGVVRVCVRVW